MPGTYKMLHRQLASFKKDLRETLAVKAGVYARELTDRITEACPYPTMASSFVLQHWNLPDGHVFIVGTTFYRPEAVWGVEKGRPSIYIYNPKGFPIHGAKKPPSERASPEEKRKFEAEGVIIRKEATLPAIPPKPFIIPALLQSEARLMDLLNQGVLEAVRRNAA